jgi:hypothetical protein
MADIPTKVKIRAKCFIVFLDPPTADSAGAELASKKA